MVTTKPQEIIATIYDAALDPTRWTDALRRVQTSLDGCVAGIRFERPSSGSLPEFMFHDLDPDFARSYVTHYAAIDPYLRSVENQTPGAVFRGEDVLGQEAYQRSEYVNEWALPQGFRHVLGGAVMRSDPIDSAFLVGRNASAGPFTEAELDFVEVLSPHLARAVQIQWHVAGARVGAEALEDVLDRVSVAILLVDGSGRCIFQNAAAERLDRCADGLTVDADGVRTAVASETRALRSAMARAAATSAGLGVEAGSVVRVSRPSGAPDLDILVTPLRSGGEEGGPGRPIAGLFVRPDDPPVSLRARSLERLYGLTPAQAELARRLADGESLREIAERLELSIATIRDRAKQVLARTGAARQAELMRLLVSGPAGFEGSPEE